MFNNNMLIMFLFLNKFKNKKLIIVLPTNFYSSWLIYHNNFLKIYKNKTKINYTNFFNNSNKINLNKSTKLKNIIKFKNNNSLFKSGFNFKKFLMSRLVNTKKKHFKKKPKHMYVNRSYDLKLKLRKLLNTNKIFLSFFLKKKFKNIWKYAKYIKNFTKDDYKIKYMNSELNIKNILAKSNFFTKYNHLERFFLEGSVYLNGTICYNMNKILIVNDVISIDYNSNYFLYNRNNLDSTFFAANNLIYKNFRKSFFNKTYSNKVKNLIYFKKDSPKFLEVDFLTMTCFILYKPTLAKDWGFYLDRYISLHSSRTYNWKFIV